MLSKNSKKIIENPKIIIENKEYGNVTQHAKQYGYDFNDIKRTKRWKNLIKDYKDYEPLIITSGCEKKYFGTYIKKIFIDMFDKEYNIEQGDKNKINNFGKDINQQDNDIDFTNISPGDTIPKRIGYVHIKQNTQTKEINITIKKHKLNTKKQKDYNITTIKVADCDYITKMYNIYEEFINSQTNIKNIIDKFRKLCSGKFVIDKQQQLELIDQQISQLENKIKNSDNKIEISQIAGKLYEYYFSREQLKNNQNIVIWQYLDQAVRNKFGEFDKQDYGIDCVDQKNLIFYQLKYYSSSPSKEKIQGFINFIDSYRDNQFKVTFKIVIPEKCQLSSSFNNLLKEYNIQQVNQTYQELDKLIQDRLQEIQTE